MKKKQLVCSALAAAMMLSTAAPGASAASFSDSAGHWGESSIDRWSNSGVLNGIDNAFNPNASITRGELATILAEMLGLEERASDTYPDLNGGWYTDAMLKCAAAGIMTGDDHGQMRPYDNVTGAEIAVILNKALDLSSSRANYPASRTGYVKPWAQSYVDAITTRGIAVGNDGGTFEPMQATSRAAFVSMLDRAVDTYISSPGSYSADGLTIVNTTGTVTLSGTPTSVDITESSTGANVILDRTNVSGPVHVKGARIHLTARNATLNDTQVKGYGCTISLEGNTNGGTVQVNSGADTTNVSVASTSQAGQIISDASKTSIDIYGDVNNIKLDTGATGSSITVRSGATVENVTSEANDVNVSGSGTLRRADVYGSNNRVTTPNTTVNNTSTTTTTSSRTKVRRRPIAYSDRHTVSFYYDDGTGRRLYTSVPVYNGDRAGSVSEPQHTGAYIFDRWEYESYYYGGYYDGYYYDYDYYCDWDYWYKDGKWVWDSSERAYHLRSTDLWYDNVRNEYFVFTNGNRVVVSGNKLYDYYDRYYYYDDGYYYYDDALWRENSNWIWSRAWNAYYNDFGQVYHDSKGYFIVKAGEKEYISASRARDRLGSYYIDGYYRNGYYKNGKWYYYDKDGYYRDGYYKNGKWYYYDHDYYYGSPYYYDYHVGDTYNPNDRIYGDVNLIARWKQCYLATTPAEVAGYTGNLVIKYTGDASLDGLNLPGKTIYLVKNVSHNTVNGTGTFTGPGSTGNGGSVTPTPPVTTDQVKTTADAAFASIGTPGAGANEYTVSSTTAFTRDQTLQSVAGKLAGLRTNLGSNVTMRVNGTVVAVGATTEQIVNLIRGYTPALMSAEADSAIDPTIVQITYTNAAGTTVDLKYTINYMIESTATPGAEDNLAALKALLANSTSGAGIASGSCSAKASQIAIAVGLSSGSCRVKIVGPNNVEINSSNVGTLKQGDTLNVSIVDATNAAEVKTIPYSTVSFVAEAGTAATTANSTFVSNLGSLCSGTTITLQNADDAATLSRELAAATALKVSSSTYDFAKGQNGTIVLVDAVNGAPVATYNVVISSTVSQAEEQKAADEAAKKAAEEAAKKAAEEAAKKAADEAAKKAADEAAKKAADEAAKKAAEEAAKKAADEAAKKAAEEAAKQGNENINTPVTPVTPAPQPSSSIQSSVLNSRIAILQSKLASLSPDDPEYARLLAELQRLQSQLGSN